MSDITKYKDEIITELYGFSRNIDRDEIIEAYTEAVHDLNLDTSNYNELINKLGTPMEFINYYINEKLSGSDKRESKKSMPIIKLEMRIKQILDTPITFIDNNSFSRFIVLLFPSMVVVITLLFGNYVDYNYSDNIYYDSLLLIMFFPLYELFVLFTRTHLTSYTHATILRNIHRGILIGGLLIYLVNPFSYKGSVRQYLDAYPEREGSVSIAGPYQHILGMWLYVLMAFEFIILLQEITNISSSLTYYAKRVPIKLLMYEIVVTVGIFISILIDDHDSIMNWIVLSCFIAILYFQIYRNLSSINHALSNYISPVLFFIFVMISYVNIIDIEFINILEIRFLFPFLIIGLTSSMKEIADKPVIKSSNYGSANEFVMQSQIKISSNPILGKIKIYYVLLIFLSIEIYSGIYGNDDGREFSGVGLLILFVVTFMMIELDMFNTRFLSPLLITLNKNKFLVLFFLFSTFTVFAGFANFYETVNLRAYNSPFKDIDYKLVYLELFLYSIFYGVILVLIQNSARNTLNLSSWKSLNIVISLLFIELVSCMVYLQTIAFSGPDASYFKGSQNEIYLGLVYFICLQLLIPILNTLQFSNKEPNFVIYNTA